MKKRILITGASGFISRWLIKRLMKSGVFEVYLLHSSESENSEYNLKVNHVFCDIGDEVQTREALAHTSIDYIYHFAAKSTIGDSQNSPLETFKTNIQGTWNLLQIAKEKNVKGVVFASSMSVYDEHNKSPLSETDEINSKTTYGVSKICGEHIAQLYGTTFNLPVLIVRLGMVFGGGDSQNSRLIPSIVNSLLKNKELQLRSPADTLIDPIYVKDLVEALVKAISYFKTKKVKAEVLNISSGTPVSIKEIVDILTNVSKAGKISVKYGDYISVKRYMNIEKVVKKIDWNPSYALNEGLKETFLWYYKR